MTLKFEPWGDDPEFDWDDYNTAKMWEHRIRDFEIEECFENAHFVRPHQKAKSHPEKYGDRYFVCGVTDGGRKLVIVVQYKGANIVRPITAWDE